MRIKTSNVIASSLRRAARSPAWYFRDQVSSSVSKLFIRKTGPAILPIPNDQGASQFCLVWMMMPMCSGRVWVTLVPWLDDDDWVEKWIAGLGSYHPLVTWRILQSDLTVQSQLNWKQPKANSCSLIDSVFPLRLPSYNHEISRLSCCHDRRLLARRVVPALVS